jgi:hypothetical protein
MAWSRRTSRDNGLGYPTSCIYLKERIGKSAASHEPTGYSSAEVHAVGNHVMGLRMMRKLAIMRYCKPWMCNAINMELGREFDTDTWLYHLRGALAEIVELMDKKRLTARESSVITAEI